MRRALRELGSMPCDCSMDLTAAGLTPAGRADVDWARAEELTGPIGVRLAARMRLARMRVERLLASRRLVSEVMGILG